MQVMPEIEELSRWIGREQRASGLIAQQHANLLRSIMPGVPELAAGDPLPPLWEWLYFPLVVPLTELGADGHPAKGSIMPPISLPRRMWAGGRIEYLGGLRIDHEAEKVSTIVSISPKRGRSGALCIVTVDHVYRMDGATVIREQQDIVYRQAAEAGTGESKPLDAPTGAEFEETVQPDPILLFRYSALTFNGHRIHYDRDYCRDVEGYPGLVVHGPLIATLLANLAIRHSAGRFMSFAYRGVSPLFDTAPFRIAGRRSGNSVELWAANNRGGLAMQATAELEAV